MLFRSDRQLQAIEEIAELQVAVSHYRRKRPGAREAVAEELADAEIVIEQLLCACKGTTGQGPYTPPLNDWTIVLEIATFAHCVLAFALWDPNKIAWNMKDALVNETRFTPLATVPLQDGAMAAQVLREVMADGFGGIMIGTLPKGQGGNLDDPNLDPFWQAASDLKAAVVLHPMFLCGEPRLAEYDLVNAIGRVADTSIAVARLLFSGHLLKFPGVKLVLSHGGAALPFVLGRLARNFTIAQGKYADPRAGFEALY